MKIDTGLDKLEICRKKYCWEMGAWKSIHVFGYLNLMVMMLF